MGQVLLLTSQKLLSFLYILNCYFKEQLLGTTDVKNSICLERYGSGDPCYSCDCGWCCGTVGRVPYWYAQPSGSVPRLQKHDVTSHVTGGADRGQEVQCHPLLHPASRLSLGYMRPSLEFKKQDVRALDWAGGAGDTNS